MALRSIFGTTSTGIGSTPAWRKAQDRAHDVLSANWHLGLTAFGGPPVHFQIFRRKFVEGIKWIDEQTYQELFAIANALPGPGSTKMLFNINTIHGGFVSGNLAFLLWSFPGAIGMFCFSLGVSRIGETLPDAVYALLSGLNAATVGIIALAAVQLSQKVITDDLTRALVFLGGAAGMLYTALWYFPVLMAAAGIFTVIWDLRLLQRLTRTIMPRRPRPDQITELEESRNHDGATRISTSSRRSIATSSQRDAVSSGHLHQTRQVGASNNLSPAQEDVSSESPPHAESVDRSRAILTWRRGVLVLAAFFASFLAVMLVRGLIKSPPRVFAIFANLLLAGTIIFGGGPVVIPLLREYVVAEGWVSPRDFLLGLALIQAFPGPNFNFAVYLGALSVAGTRNAPIAGAVVAFLGIFSPGLVVQTGFMGLWGSIRKSRPLLSVLRGVNAAAVGLVFTAVYRFWQIGYLDSNNQDGQPLGVSPWWVVVTATSFVGGASFKLNPPGAVVLGGVMGMIWYGVTRARGNDF